MQKKLENSKIRDKKKNPFEDNNSLIRDRKIKSVTIRVKKYN